MMTEKEGKKCYIYSRVSTSMQVDGYSLDAQVERMRRYADYERMIIADSYCDEGKSGKNIEGRPEFQRMLADIENKKDDVAFVLVFKLSRFGRNAADVLSSLKRMRRYGVNLICVEESIDSSKDSGKLMISVLSAVAEIERENILVQTMEGRKEKARKGLWNGGFAPYGYKLENGKLVIADDEKDIIQYIFKQYASTTKGILTIAKELSQRGIKKKVRQNGTSSEIGVSFIKGILDNPTYVGKIAYGRRKTQLIEGSDEQYNIVKSDDYILVDGEHEALIDEKTWNAVQKKRKETGGRKEFVYHADRRHLLSSILKCPECGANMYGNVRRKKNPDGSLYSEYFYYMCKHRRTCEVTKKNCTYKKQWKEERVNAAVEQLISKLVNNENFANALKAKIGTKIDTAEIDKVIADYNKQLAKTERKLTMIEDKLAEIDIDDKYYKRKSERYEKQIEDLYDEIDGIELSIKESKERRHSIQMNAITTDNIYKYLLYFDKTYSKMTDDEKKTLLESFISAIYLFPEEQENGQFLKRIDFKFPVFYDGEETNVLVLDKKSQVETVVLLSQKRPDDYINVSLDLEDKDLTPAESKPTCDGIRNYIKKKYNENVTRIYIAQIKRKYGLEVRKNYRLSQKEDARVPQCPKEKEEMIVDALRHFQML